MIRVGLGLGRRELQCAEVVAPRLLEALEPFPHRDGVLALRMSLQVAARQDRGCPAGRFHERVADQSVREADHHVHHVGEIHGPLQGTRQVSVASAVREGPEEEPAKHRLGLGAARHAVGPVGVLLGARNRRHGVASHVRALVAEVRDLLQLLPHRRLVPRLSRDGRQCKGGLVGQRPLRVPFQERRRHLLDGACASQQRHRQPSLQGRVAVAGFDAPGPIPQPDRAAPLGLAKQPGGFAIFGGVAQRPLGEGESPRRIVALQRLFRIAHIPVPQGAEPAQLRVLDPVDQDRRLGRVRLPLDETLPVREGLALRDGELGVLVLREGHADGRLKQAEGEHGSTHGGTPQRLGVGIEGAADPPHSRIANAGAREPEGIVGDLLLEPGLQQGIHVLAPPQCVGSSPVGEGVVQGGVPGVERVGKNARGRLAPLPARGVVGHQRFDAVVDRRAVASQDRLRQRVGQRVVLVGHVGADRRQGLHGREDGRRAPGAAQDERQCPRDQSRAAAEPSLSELRSATPRCAPGTPSARRACGSTG